MKNLNPLLIKLPSLLAPCFCWSGRLSFQYESFYLGLNLLVQVHALLLEGRTSPRVDMIRTLVNLDAHFILLSPLRSNGGANNRKEEQLDRGKAPESFEFY